MRLSARYTEKATIKYTKSQSSVLGKSLLWGGGGFLFVALIAFLISFFAFGWNNPNYDIVNEIFKGNYDLFYGIFWSLAIIGMLVGSLLMMFWSFSITQAGWTRIIITYIVEILAWGFAFGVIMGMYGQYSSYDMAFALGLTGVIFLLMGFVGYFMSTKFAMSLGKIIGIGSAILLVVNLVFWLVLWFGFMAPNPQEFINAGNLWWMITVPIFTIFSIGYIALDFFMISKSSLFVSQLEPEQAKKVEAYFGLQIMTDFSYLLYLLLMLFRIFKRD